MSPLYNAIQQQNKQRTYTYMMYFYDDASIKDSKEYREIIVEPSVEYKQFKQHIQEIGALDLTKPENQQKFPTRYWKIAIVLNIHLYQSDFLNYLKIIVYKDPVFNLIYPNLQKHILCPALVTFHKQINHAKNPPLNLSAIFAYIIGENTSGLSQQTIQYYELMCQQAFEQIRNR